MKRILHAIIFSLFSVVTVFGQSANNQPVIPGAERMNVYLPLLKGKAVAVFANQTSLVKSTHLVDTLLQSGINVVKIFGPEHGFRGNADAGEHVGDAKDAKTGIPVISLYGNHKKPTADDLKDVDVLVFDIQDVGVRFYTYISSLQYYLEAALENHKPLMILDRPNPNGFYVDGPVLDTNFKSFIGMQPIPIVYGMTIGEYALMLAGENWLSAKANAINAYNITTEPTADTPFHVTVIKCKNYDHKTKYILPVNPSPNLREMQSIYLYPSTCLFEGTVVSLGRGTSFPFQVYGHPDYKGSDFSFTPRSVPGAKNPPLLNKKCYGVDLRNVSQEYIWENGFDLSYVIDAYKNLKMGDKFFTGFFEKLVGVDYVRQDIIAGKSAQEIKEKWYCDIVRFKQQRRPYLLYGE